MAKQTSMRNLELFWQCSRVLAKMSNTLFPQNLQLFINIPFTVVSPDLLLQAAVTTFWLCRQGFSVVLNAI